MTALVRNDGCHLGIFLRSEICYSTFHFVIYSTSTTTLAPTPIKDGRCSNKVECPDGQTCLPDYAEYFRENEPWASGYEGSCVDVKNEDGIKCNYILPNFRQCPPKMHCANRNLCVILLVDDDDQCKHITSANSAISYLQRRLHYPLK